MIKGRAKDIKEVTPDSPPGSGYADLKLEEVGSMPMRLCLRSVMDHCDSYSRNTSEAVDASSDKIN